MAISAQKLNKNSFAKCKTYLISEHKSILNLLNSRSQLSNSLSSLSTSASNLPTQIPPEIIDYVEDGRNPDIYTREFVELAQKGNQYLKGKSEAFAAFRDVLAEEIVRAMPEMKAEVGRVMAGRVEEEQKNQNGGTQIS